MKHQLPHELHNDANWLRNVMVSLRNFDSVLIEYTLDDAATEATGERQGEWSIEIYAPDKTGRTKRHTEEGSEFLAVLYSAVTEAELSEDEFYAERKRVRQEALAKLSAEEKRILGIQ